MGIGLAKEVSILDEYNTWLQSQKTHHWADIRVRYGVKLLVLELIIGANVDISATVLGRVAVLGSGKDCRFKS